MARKIALIAQRHPFSLEFLKVFLKVLKVGYRRMLAELTMVLLTRTSSACVLQVLGTLNNIRASQKLHTKYRPLQIAHIYASIPKRSATQPTMQV